MLNLEGLHILVTRPFLHGIKICQLIREYNGIAIHFPVIKILEPENTKFFKKNLEALSQFDLVIFISISSVIHFSRAIVKNSISIPNNLKIAAIGNKTAHHCSQLGIKVNYVPSQSNSEGLLETLEGFPIKNSRIAIFRGQSGLEKLKESLLSKGAQVKYVESYRRIITSSSIQPLVNQWKIGNIDLVIITSNSILQGLFTLLGKRDSYLLEQTPIVTISDRIVVECRRNQVQSKIFVSKLPDEQNILKTVEQFINS